MDIWQWVGARKRELRESGQERLASLMSALPSLVCDDEHARVEALVPEALGLARAAKLPWVEVFVRHWLLQSRVFHRHDVGRSRHEAVSLLEFANREETRGCPQSVCVTQDLAGCYSRVDGPGYVRERLQVARESLDRIDPSWPCYSCISSEYADALLDGGREEEALEFVRAQVAAAAAEGEFLEEDFALTEAHALILLGRFAEAETRLDEHHHPAGGESHAVETRLMRAWALVGLGRFEQAMAERPTFAAIVETADHYESWMMVTLGLVRGGLVDNDFLLGRQLRELYRRLEVNGALWGATATAIEALKLAWARGCERVAGLIAADVERLAGGLLRPPPLPKRPALSAERALGVTASTEGAVEALSGELPDDPEAALDLLGDARASFADDPQLAARWAQGLRNVGFAEEGLRDLEAFAEGHPGDGQTLVELCRLYLACGDSPAIASLVRERLCDFPELYPTGLWILAQAEASAGTIDAAIITLRALLELAPDSELALGRLADLLRAEERYVEALAVRRRLVERLEPGPHDWDLMSEATIAGEWALVRRSAARLGIPAEPAGSGPIDGSYGMCRVSVGDDDVSVRGKGLLWAERRGPVTAQIIEIVGPHGSERYDDLVVFDAANLRQDEEGDEGGGEENPRRHPVFRAIKVLKPGRMVSYAIDGPHPGDELLAELRELFVGYGGRLWVCSGENYRLFDSGADGDGQAEREDGSAAPRLLGLYAYFAVPASVSLSEVDARLAEITAAAPYPMAWIELIEALGPGAAKVAALVHHRQLIARFGL